MQEAADATRGGRNKDAGDDRGSGVALLASLALDCWQSGLGLLPLQTLASRGAGLFALQTLGSPDSGLSRGRTVASPNPCALPIDLLPLA